MGATGAQERYNKKTVIQDQYEKDLGKYGPKTREPNESEVSQAGVGKFLGIDKWIAPARAIETDRRLQRATNAAIMEHSTLAHGLYDLDSTDPEKASKAYQGAQGVAIKLSPIGLDGKPKEPDRWGAAGDVWGQLTSGDSPWLQKWGPNIIAGLGTFAGAKLLGADNVTALAGGALGGWVGGNGYKALNNPTAPPPPQPQKSPNSPTGVHPGTPAPDAALKEPAVNMDNAVAAGQKATIRPGQRPQ